MNSQYRLVLDIGNTHTVAGLYIFKTDELLANVRFRTNALNTADEYRAQVTQLLQGKMEFHWNQIQQVVASSVVPALERTLNETFLELPFYLIKSSSPASFDLTIPHPSQLGADRLANAEGAIHELKNLKLAEHPFLIVDLGTATTFCLFDWKNGERPYYLGGAIVPGLETSFHALASKAARLFSVELSYPANAVGNTTETQLQSGMMYGYESLIIGLTKKIVKDSHLTSQPIVFVTGGCAQILKFEQLQKDWKTLIVPNLTLEGLVCYGKNFERHAK